LLASVLNINAGGSSLVDHGGVTWEADRGFTGGDVSRLKFGVSGTPDDKLFYQRRHGKSFTFSAKVKNGQYTLELYFVEPTATKTGERAFSVVAEDRRIIRNIDLYSVGGSKTAIVRRVNVEITDGRLSLGFRASIDEAIVSAICLKRGYIFSPEKITWQNAPSGPIEREESQSFVYNDKMYVVGGYIDTPEFHATTRVDIFDHATGKWSKGAAAPYKVTHAGVAQDGAATWFIGGYVGDFPDPPGTSSVLIYNARKNRWRHGPDLPSPRGAGGAGIVGTTLYYFGGGSKNRDADNGDMWSLDLNNPTHWTRRASIPNPRNHFGYATVNGKIYAIGGQHLLEKESTNQDELDVYDPATDKWTRLENLPKPYSHFGASTVVYDKRYILIVGGESPHDVGQPNVYAYDTITDQWAEMTPLPAPRRAGAAGLFGDTLFMTTGYVRANGQTSTSFKADLDDVFD
jgi:N-acetylneuraminic acid mutarotase